MKIPLAMFRGKTPKTFIETRLFQETLASAEAFFTNHHVEENGYILKAPHVEHGVGYRFYFLLLSPLHLSLVPYLIKPVCPNPPPPPVAVEPAKEAENIKNKSKKRKRKIAGLKKKYEKGKQKKIKPNYKSFVDQLRGVLLQTMNGSTAINQIHNNKACDIFPYLILQERMVHDNESKIVLLGGQARFPLTLLPHSPLRLTPLPDTPLRPPRFVTSVDKQSGLIKAKKFEAVSRETLFKFAEDAYQELKKNCPYFCCEPMVRVDVFKTKDGRLVVNEFESLSANYGCANHNEELVVYDYILNFWESKLRAFLYRINRFK